MHTQLHRCPRTFKGPFGHVDLVRDWHLSKTIAVKKVNLDQCNQLSVRSVFCFEFDEALYTATIATRNQIPEPFLNSNSHNFAHFLKA